MRKAPKNHRLITPKHCCGTCTDLRFDGGLGYCLRSYEQLKDKEMFPEVSWDAGEIERPWQHVCDYWTSGRYS